MYLAGFLPWVDLNQAQDTERRQDASIVSSAVTNYTSAYRKAVTASTSENDLRKYVNNLSTNYSGSDAVQIKADSYTDTPPLDQIWVHPATKCEGTNAVKSDSVRSATVRISLEDETAYCIPAS
jgi:hypothetical protein